MTVRVVSELERDAARHRRASCSLCACAITAGAPVVDRRCANADRIWRTGSHASCDEVAARLFVLYPWAYVDGMHAGDWTAAVLSDDDDAIPHPVHWPTASGALRLGVLRRACASGLVCRTLTDAELLAWAYGTPPARGRQ